MKSMVLFFVMVVVTLVAVVAGIGGLGVLYQKHQIRVEQEREAAFQKEFGIKYPTTPVDKGKAVATVLAHIAEERQEWIDSGNRYFSAMDAWKAVYESSQPPSFREEKARLEELKQDKKDADDAESARGIAYGKMAKSCLVLYRRDWDENTVDNYPELSIEFPTGCKEYFDNEENEKEGGNVF